MRIKMMHVAGLAAAWWVANDRLAAQSADQIVEEVQIAAPDGVGLDAFGQSLAIDGDHAAVGAPNHDAAGTNAGAVYVFSRGADGSWPMAAKLISTGATAGDLLGASTALSGTRLVVGLPGDDLIGSNSGSARVFELLEGEWVETALLASSDLAAGDAFGRAVAVSGARALVGADQDDDKGSASGSAYVFELQAGVWVQVAKLTAADGAASDLLASTVALSGDRAVLGSPQDDDLGANSGSAYVFERLADGTWSQVAKLRASDGLAGDRFGGSVSLSAARAVIGATNHDAKGGNSGTAYVFERQADGTWSQVAKLLASDGLAGDLFGTSVAISGDRALAGAPSNDGAAFEAGAAYLYVRQADGTWPQTKKLAWSAPLGSDATGSAVALSTHRALLGAPGADATVVNSGAARMWLLEPLQAEVTHISMRLGGLVSMMVSGGHSNAGKMYIVLGSESGTEPGISVPGGLVLHLKPDIYTKFTLHHPNHPPLKKSMGVLGPHGAATTTFSLRKLHPGLVGITVHHAFVVIDPATGLVSLTSNPLPIELTQ